MCLAGEGVCLAGEGVFLVGGVGARAERGAEAGAAWVAPACPLTGRLVGLNSGTFAGIRVAGIGLKGWGHRQGQEPFGRS